MSVTGLNVQTVEWWYRSGMAKESARDLAWFVVLVVVAIGFVIWLDMRKDKGERK